jgi:hypothetical protein
MKKSFALLILALVLALSAAAAPAANAGCFQDYLKKVDSCSELSSWVDRSACGLDAAVELAGCNRRVIMG